MTPAQEKEAAMQLEATAYADHGQNTVVMLRKNTCVTYDLAYKGYRLNSPWFNFEGHAGRGIVTIENVEYDIYATRGYETIAYYYVNVEIDGVTYTRRLREVKA